MERSWTFAIDRGGTFTDVVARSSDGRLRVEKLLSENPGRYDGTRSSDYDGPLARRHEPAVAATQTFTGQFQCLLLTG